MGKFILIVLTGITDAAQQTFSCQLIKQRKKTALIPIIFLTAYYNDDVHVLEGYGSGAVDSRTTSGPCTRITSPDASPAIV